MNNNQLSHQALSRRHQSQRTAILAKKGRTSASSSAGAGRTAGSLIGKDGGAACEEEEERRGAEGDHGVDEVREG